MSRDDDSDGEVGGEMNDPDEVKEDDNYEEEEAGGGDDDVEVDEEVQSEMVET